MGLRQGEDHELIGCDDRDVLLPVPRLVRDRVGVGGGLEATIDLVLRLAALAETVSVTATTPPVETTDHESAEQ